MWAVIQIGAREHYQIPKMMHRSGKLSVLITDFWMPKWANKYYFGRVSGRRNEEIPDSMVVSYNFRTIIQILRYSILKKSKWYSIIDFNEKFQNWVKKDIQKILLNSKTEVKYVYIYSYSGSTIIEVLKSNNYGVVLNQIDPGIVEHEIIKKVYIKCGRPCAIPSIPEIYWLKWKKEVRKSDLIVVNSKWTHDCLVSIGIESNKMRVLPLVYEKPSFHTNMMHKRFLSLGPTKFSRSKPMRVLFLGQVIIRKGIIPLIEAMKQMEEDPVILDIVGEVKDILPIETECVNNIVWHGPVTRDKASMFYDSADIFILPTWSDGFGITQLEAMAHGVPVIASRFCGDVVRDGYNGLLLNRVSSAEIENTLRSLTVEPQRLSNMKKNSFETVIHHFSPNIWNEKLHTIERELEHIVQKRLSDPLGSKS